MSTKKQLQIAQTHSTGRGQRKASLTSAAVVSHHASLTTTVWTVWGQSSRFFVATVTAKPAMASFGLRALVWLMCISKQYLVMTVRVCCFGMVKKMWKTAPFQVKPAQRLTQGNSFPAESSCTELPWCLKHLSCSCCKAPAQGGMHRARAATRLTWARGCWDRALLPIAVVSEKDGDYEESRNYSLSSATARKREVLWEHCRGCPSSAASAAHTESLSCGRF